MTAALALLRRVPIWVWIVLVLLAIVGVQRAELSHYRASAATDATTITALRQAQTTNLETIATLRTANAQWAQKYAAQLQNAKVYVDALRDYSTKLEAKKTAAEHTIQVIYEHDPSARAWASEPVPVAVADRLRDGARRPN